MKSPINWYGGKFFMRKELLRLMPPHDYYVEVFGGGAQLLFAKPPIRHETYNDIHKGLLVLFSVLRDPDLFPEFQKQINLVLYSRAEWQHARDNWQSEPDPVKKAVMFFTLNRQSFAGKTTAGWSFSVLEISRNMPGTCSRLLSSIDGLDLIHKRLQSVQIECQDWRSILKTYNTPEYFAYVDPPYVLDTRTGGKVYDHEMTDEDHEELVTALLNYPGMVMLSAYNHEIYEPLATAGWENTIKRSVCHAAGKTRNSGLQGKGNVTAKQQRTEIIWRNPACVKRWETRGFFDHA